MHIAAHGKFVQVEELLAFCAQQKTKYVTWYHQTAYTTQTQRDHCTTYAESPPAQNLFYDGFKTLMKMKW